MENHSRRCGRSGAARRTYSAFGHGPSEVAQRKIVIQKDPDVRSHIPSPGDIQNMLRLDAELAKEL